MRESPLAAGALLTVSKPDYTSNAKLLIRYITETRGPDTAGQSEIVREPDQRGATIINSEMEILSSSDALLGAAKIVGPARILAPYGGGTNEVAAAGVLAKGLKVENARNTSVISVSLTHRDPVVAQSALRALRDQYLERHEKFHRSGDSYAALEAQKGIVPTVGVVLLLNGYAITHVPLEIMLCKLGCPPSRFVTA